MTQKHILVVDDNVTNLKIAEQTLKPYYKVTLLISAKQMLRFLDKTQPDLILMDINMPEMDGYEAIQKIKEQKNLVMVPVIFLSSQADSDSEVRGLELGAVDFISKPFVAQSMLSRIKLHLELNGYRCHLEEIVKEKTEMVEHLQNVMLQGLAELVECRDKNTGGHVKRTAQYLRVFTEAIVERKIYPELAIGDYVHDLIRSAPLHDVGKIGISDSTLLKSSSLDEEEFEYMKQHARLGGIALQKMIDKTKGESFLYIAKDMAEYHHEKWDGTGYPSGLKGEEIPISARIMAVADVYDALTTQRPYKEAFSHETAVEIILKGKGTAFDPQLIEVFEEMHMDFLLIDMEEDL